MGAATLDEPIRQVTITRSTVELFHRFREHEAVVVQPQEHFLAQDGLLRGGCPSEVVETDSEPLVDVGVDLVVFIADLLAGQALFQGLCFRCGAVFVGSADEEGVVVAHATKSVRCA